MNITQTEILDALVTASTAPEDARTMVELKATCGVGEARLRRALQIIAAEGRLGVHRIQRKTLSGYTQAIPAYTIAPRRRKSR